MVWIKTRIHHSADYTSPVKADILPFMYKSFLHFVNISRLPCKVQIRFKFCAE